ncbi:hypothetical protein ABPG72_015004 [Tetrahymena utriculariae]
MESKLSDFIANEIFQNKGEEDLQNVFSSTSIHDLVDYLSDIIISQQSIISIRAALHMFNLLDQIEEKSKKFYYEKIYLKLITQFKEYEGENIQIQAEILGALLRRYCNYLSVQDFDLLSLILAQRKRKMIKGLILLKEITSYKEWFKHLQVNNLNLTDTLQFFYKPGQAVIHGVCEIINALINKWEKKAQKETKNSKKGFKLKQEFEDQDINLLVTVCFVQLQNQMTDNQKKKVFPLIITHISSSQFIEEDKDLLFNYLNFLKSCDKNFFLKREQHVFKKLHLLIRMYEIQELKQIEENQIDNDKKKFLEEISLEIKILEANKYLSVQLGMFVFEETIERSLGKQCKFIPEMIDFMFSLCELDSITVEEKSENRFENTQNKFDSENQNSIKSNSPELDQAFIDFQYQLETINQSSKKILMNDFIFNKIVNNVKKIGQGVQSLSNNVEIIYSGQEIRTLVGCYNMLFFQTKFNVEAIRSILATLTKFIGSHLKNIYVQCYVIRFLYQIANTAINYIAPFHSSYMDIIIGILQNKQNQSLRQSIISISFLDRVVFKIVYEEDFALFDYIPKLYEICLNDFSSPSFTQQSPLYQESILNIINSILHKKKIEYYIKQYVQRSKEIFFSQVEKKEDHLNQNKIEIETENKQSIVPALPHSTTNLSCLSSLAKMVMKSQHCKDDDLVNRVKHLLRQYANELYQGKFDDQIVPRTQIYQFIYSISIELLNDQNLIDELFLKMYSHILADCQVLTNVKLIRKNKNLEQEEINFNNIINAFPQQAQNVQLPNQFQNALAQHLNQAFQNGQINQNLMQNINVVLNVNNNNNQNQQNQDQQNNNQNQQNENEGSENEYEDQISEQSEGVQQDQNENQEDLNEMQGFHFNGNEENEDEMQEEIDLEEGYEQVYFEQPNPELFALKSNALYILGEFIQECPKIVMEYKKFEIMKVLHEISVNDREENQIMYMSYQTLGQMFKCIQQYFTLYYPHLYFKNKDIIPEECFLSEEANVEYSPIFQIFLDQINNLDKLNEDNIHEELLYKLSYVLRNIDFATKRTFFFDIFNTIKHNIIKTYSLLQAGLMDKQMECLQIIYKAYPSQLQNNFQKIWKIIEANIFNQKTSQETNENYEEGEDNNQEGEEEEEEEMDKENCDENSSENEDIEEEVDEEEEGEQNMNLNKLDLDLSIISSTIGYTSHFIKYDKCVYPIVSKTINQLIFNKIFMKDEILLRNCIFYINVVTRYCFDIIQPDVFKQLFSIIGQVIQSKDIDDYDEKGTVENILTTYALMATKLLANKPPKNFSEEDLAPFNILFKIVPFEDDHSEMKRVIQIGNFLYDADQPIIQQNLLKLVQSTIQMINEPSRYRIKQKGEPYYFIFYKKLESKFPQTKQIAKNIIDQNKNNLFKEKDQLLKKLNIN